MSATQAPANTRSPDASKDRDRRKRAEPSQEQQAKWEMVFVPFEGFLGTSASKELIRRSLADEAQRKPEGRDDGILPLDALLGTSMMEPPIERHAAIISDPRFSHPVNAPTSSRIVNRLHRTYGNGHVQRVMDLVHTWRDETVSAEEVPGHVEQVIARKRGSGQPLPHGTRIQMESLFGYDFTDVLIHTDSTADSLAKALQAKAFTVGRDVFFREGAYQPRSEDGKKLLGHELTHVVQQAPAIGGSHTEKTLFADLEQIARKKKGKAKRSPKGKKGRVRAKRKTKPGVSAKSPTIPSRLDITFRPKFSWSSPDAASDIAEYHYAVGTSPKGTDAIKWTETPAAKNAKGRLKKQQKLTLTGLTLAAGTAYYVTAKAKNTTGGWSEEQVSKAIKVVEPWEQAKKPWSAKAAAALKHRASASEVNRLSRSSAKIKALLDQVDKLESTSVEYLGKHPGVRLWSQKKLRELSKKGTIARYRELEPGKRQELLGEVASCRAGIKGLAESDVEGDKDLLPRVQAFFYARLNKLTPYYTQMANINVLKKGKSEAWERTCNLTSMSMTLEGLGVTPQDFNGDRGLLLAIAHDCQDDIENEAGLLGQRMPDFLQFVAIYMQDKANLLKEYQRPDRDTKDPEKFGKLVDGARKKVAPRISSTLKIFDEVAGQFGGVTVSTGGPGRLGQLEMDRLPATKKQLKRIKSSMKSRQRLIDRLPEDRKKVDNLSEQLLQILAKKPAYQGREDELKGKLGNRVERAAELKLAKKKYRKQGRFKQRVSRLHRDISKAEKNIENEKKNRDDLARLTQDKKELEARVKKIGASITKTMWENYKLWAISTVRPLLDEGKQIIVTKFGHYMRVEDINDSGIMVDDPATAGKNAPPIEWEEAYKKAYLRSYVVLEKK